MLFVCTPLGEEEGGGGGGVDVDTKHSHMHTGVCFHTNVLAKPSLQAAYFMHTKQTIICQISLCATMSGTVLCSTHIDQIYLACHTAYFQMADMRVHFSYTCERGAKYNEV